MGKWSTGIVEVAGPFPDEDTAADWLYAEENYQPYLRICRSFQGEIYIIDPRVSDAEWHQRNPNIGLG